MNRSAVLEISYRPTRRVRWPLVGALLAAATLGGCSGETVAVDAQDGVPQASQGPIATHSSPPTHTDPPRMDTFAGVEALRLDFAAGTDPHGAAGYSVAATEDEALRAVPGESDGALAFPSPCDGKREAACPRALVEVAHVPELNPGTRDFRWSATVLLEPSQTSSGSNVMQKGFSTGGAGQWKLQVDGRDGIPGCVLVGTGSTTVHELLASTSIADGTWHNVSCLRQGASLTVEIDGEKQGHLDLPPELDIVNDAPVRIGAKSLKGNNDQFFGVIDDVLVEVGPA